ncbi:MAG: hypothetical protein CVT48_04995 [Thermoplasmata archaeon HGW-Thermoplasmata-1]|nr:MAG: hypothetical protein CVT48_04995 [Thermoplasmata archaeon HGW-Thermoplasmata-1]
MVEEKGDSVAKIRSVRENVRGDIERVTAFLQNANLKKAGIILLLSSFGLVALTGIIILIIGGQNKTQMNILFTSLAIAAYSFMALCSFLLQSKRPSAPVILFTLKSFVLYLTGLVLLIFTIWLDYKIKGFDDLIKAAGSFGVISLACAHSSLMLLVNRADRRVRAVLAVTLCAISIVAAMLVILIIWNDDITDISRYLRALGVFIILDALGTIATPIAPKAFSRDKKQPDA